MLTTRRGASAQALAAGLFAALFASYSIAWGAGSSKCQPPASVAKQITESFSGYNVVTADTLRASDRRRFRAEHPDSCPGLVKLDFYGTGAPTYALALIKRQDKQVLLRLIIATRLKAAAWELREINQADNLVTAPAIWSEPPGEYKDVRESRVIRARYPVLLAVQYEAWAIAFAWDGNEVQKVWVTD